MNHFVFLLNLFGKKPSLLRRKERKRMDFDSLDLTKKQWPTMPLDLGHILISRNLLSHPGKKRYVSTFSVDSFVIVFDPLESTRQ